MERQELIFATQDDEEYMGELLCAFGKDQTGTRFEDESLAPLTYNVPTVTVQIPPMARQVCNVLISMDRQCDVSGAKTILEDAFALPWQEHLPPGDGEYICRIVQEFGELHCRIVAGNTKPTPGTVWQSLLSLSDGASDSLLSALSKHTVFQQELHHLLAAIILESYKAKMKNEADMKK